MRRDDLSMARGVYLGVALGLLFWLAVVAVCALL